MRRPETIEARLATACQARALCAQAALRAVSVRQLRLLTAELRVL